MNNIVYTLISSIEQADCFGGYDMNNLLCSNHCALRLRCAIEQENNMRSELFEELFVFEGTSVKLQ
jgi:phosphotransferase system IIB component